jgi:hypothetical protein
MDKLAHEAAMTIYKRVDGKYDVGVQHELTSNHYPDLTWDEVLVRVDGIRPSAWKVLGQYYIGQSSLSEQALGTGVTMADAAHRQAIAKLADDLERIKRARQS